MKLCGTADDDKLVGKAASCFYTNEEEREGSWCDDGEVVRERNDYGGSKNH